MKKLITLISATVIAFALAACGSTPATTPTPAPTESAAPTEDSGAAPTEDAGTEGAEEDNGATGTEGGETSGAYKPGTYPAEAAAFDEKSGYKDAVTVTVGEDGTITDVNWDAYNEAGETKKTLGDDYGMKASSSIGKEWYEQAEAMEQELIAKQDPAAIPLNAEGYADGVSGCTIHANAFVALAQEALNQAK